MAMIGHEAPELRDLLVIVCGTAFLQACAFGARTTLCNRIQVRPLLDFLPRTSLTQRLCRLSHSQERKSRTVERAAPYKPVTPLSFRVVMIRIIAGPRAGIRVRLRWSSWSVP